jgi:hypothetical protein
MKQTKVYRLGMGKGHTRSTFVKVEWDGMRLSLIGVEGPMSNGDCEGACGQIDMYEWHFTLYAPGWDAESVKKLRDIWQRWHLNDMRAGCQHQREEERKGRKWAIREECPDCHYRYGTQWLHETVPQDVIDWLFSRPDADRQPAWV